MTDTVGLVGWGSHVPAAVQTAADLAPLTGIPEEVLRAKMGIVQRHVAGPDDRVTAMAAAAARKALAQAGLDAGAVRAVISHGSEHKDHLVWNAAAAIQHALGAEAAFAFEVYALCAGAPVALGVARGMMLADPALDVVLLAAGSREHDLLNPANARSRFMLNFGAGGGAMLLQRNAPRNTLLGTSAFTDGSLSHAVVLTQDAVPADEDAAVGDLRGRLDVTDPALMADRLGATSLTNFVRVVHEAVEKGGAHPRDVAFLGLTHMKRSFTDEIFAALGLRADQGVYLDHYGHVQSVDQVLALELGLAQGKIRDGDLVVLAGAGTGYTWSAAAFRWGPA